MGRIHTPRGYGDVITEDYNEIRPEDSHDEKVAKLEMWIAKNVGKVLVNNYPNRQWKVMVDVEGKMLIIACDSVCNYKGYHIHMEGRNLHDLEKKAKFAAGEILERHNLARSRHFDADQLETIKRDVTDSVITPDSAPEPI